MSMQSDSATQIDLVRESRQRQKITLANAYLQTIYRRLALATVLIPFVGSVVAIRLLWLSGIRSVEVGLLVSMYALTTVGIEVGFHRHFSHRAFQTRTAIRVILAILGSMAAQGGSTNNIWLAIPSWGQSWHNNHHAFPNSAIIGSEWWQIDLGAWVIRLLELLGLVWNINVPTAKAIEAKKAS
jgi:fatty-acid desaturase